MPREVIHRCVRYQKREATTGRTGASTVDVGSSAFSDVDVLEEDDDDDDDAAAVVKQRRAARAIIGAVLVDGADAIALNNIIFDFF